jgi:predicted PhzF superfamily epimerase YddE/YHI9
MREFGYEVCDVFASRPLEGNQLAVFPDAAPLSESEMQAIAREMNLSETTFILRRDKGTEEAKGIRVRIFTTQEELAFAGHPTLGTAANAKFFYALAPEGPGAWRARMQFYNGEDPATGSAAGCAISYLVKHGLCAPGERLHLRQGIEIKRPSDLYVSANFENGRVGKVRVAGSTVPVAKGRLFLE